ncbi:MAG: hypothetical protein AAF561_10380, partial [Planctomycetota bacterium]
MLKNLTKFLFAFAAAGLAVQASAQTSDGLVKNSSALREAFASAAANTSAATVSLVGVGGEADGEQVALGLLVSDDGLLVTKAS